VSAAADDPGTGPGPDSGPDPDPDSGAEPPDIPGDLARGSPVFLVGMMGAGKTTVGRLLAQGLRYAFVDVDAELERRTGVRIATMFEVEGEAGFRDREELLLDELSGRTAIVLATGGGAVLRAANRERLRSRGLVIFLDVAAVEIARRTQHDTSRPLLNSPDRRARIDELLEVRQPLYRASAHLRFRSPARNPRRLASSILAHPALAPLLPASFHPAGHAPGPQDT
jgi:shikimate kinase